MALPGFYTIVEKGSWRMSKIRDLIVAANSASNRTKGVYASWAKKKNINYHALYILYVLYVLNESDGTTQKQMRKSNGIPKQTINNVITNFAKDGYVKIIPGDDDKRERVIVLTKKGRDYAHEIVSPLLAMEEEAAKIMGPARMTLLAETMADFGQILENIMNSSKHDKPGRA
jgi:DNA-binding MarR family transcriptional regulator